MSEGSKQTTTFYCATCKSAEPMDKDQLKAHVKDAHRFGGTLVGTQQASAFLDGAKGYFRQEFAVKLSCGVELTKVVEGGGK